MNEIRELIDYLNEQTHKYNRGVPDITDKEYDDKYFELKTLEDTYHIYYPDSPTQSISYQVVNALEKVEHDHDMLSLDKTKSLDEVKSFLGEKPYIAMAKMDGLTCSLRYENGKLIKAETRGNGKIGESILHNALVVSNIPKEIPYQGALVVDGEIICDYKNFEAFSVEYKNPRNFASGSIRLLDSQECAKRNLSFVAWEVIEGLEEISYLSGKLSEIEAYGFTIVPYCTNPGANINLTIDEMVESLTEKSKDLFYPIDGLVFKFNDWRFGQTLGQTGHHARNALAYKFYDEEYETILRDIAWDVGRTGVLTPVAIFKPVDADGSIIERASLHNLTIMEETIHIPFVGQKMRVFKANQIIPQVSWSEHPDKDPGTVIPLPTVCPICGAPVEIKSDTESKFLYCSNPECEGKFINRVEHFCGKKGLDIKGISKATIEKLLDWDWLNSLEDIFELAQYRNEWIKKPGFGAKSVDKILEAIAASTKCNLNSFIAALGIPLIGTTASKDLAKHFKTWSAFISAAEDPKYKFWELPNFGDEMSGALHRFDYTDAKVIADKYLIFNTIEESVAANSLAGLTFVITGKVNQFKNRDELKAKIESLGGKVVGSVSGKTNYLINNDSTSTSAKNVKAKELGIPILTEDEFIETFGQLN